MRRSAARFKVLCAGRRWGKTRLGILLGLATAIYRGRCWWVAPEYPTALIAWRQFKPLVLQLQRQIPGIEIREAERMITFLGGGFIQMKTAENPKSLRGEGLDLLIVDEAAHVAGWDEVWNLALRPALSDRQGRALFVSTPKGHNHFHELYRRSEMQPDWCSWHLPSSSNPYLHPDEIEKARQDLTDLEFRQEYGAEFVQLSGAMVKREWFDIVEDVPQCTRWARFYDLAASTKTSADYTCGVKVGWRDGTLVIADMVWGRWEWPDVLKIIRQTALSDGPRVTVGIEDVGVQKGLYQMVRREPMLAGITIRPIKVTTDKITRANPWIARAEQGNILLKRAGWNQDFLNQVCAFPETAHDDIVDSVSGAVQMLTGATVGFVPVGA